MSDTLQTERPSAYRWLMLILVSLPNFGTNYAQFQLSAFAADFMADLGLTTIQFSAVTLSFSIVAGIIGVCGGTLADRLGTRRVAVVLCFITAAASLGRLLTHSYGVFFLLSLFVGCGLGAVHATSSKIISAWFPQREASFAFSLYCAIGAAGISLAQLTSSLYTGYRQALLAAGLVLLLAAVLWLFLGRDAPKGTALPPSQPVLKYISQVIKLRNVWIVALCCALFSAFIYTVSTLLPTVLADTRSMDATQANSLASMLNIAAIIGSVVIPPIQTRLGKFRPVLAVLMPLTAVFILPLAIAPDGLVLPLICLMGFCVSIGCAFFMAILAGLPEVGTEYLGSAQGLVTLIHYVVGGFVIPSFIITPLVDISGNLLFVAAAVLCILMTVGTLLLPETGHRAKE
ncbi:MAG: MFS transporter [Oscillospiraceae bacterium]|nr:MFS transporter [Oscillospiraceae bacterium]